MKLHQPEGSIPRAGIPAFQAPGDVFKTSQRGWPGSVCCGTRGDLLQLRRTMRSTPQVTRGTLAEPLQGPESHG